MLLDTGFLLYSATKMEGLKITKIERQENDEAEIYIWDEGDKLNITGTFTPLVRIEETIVPD